MMTAVEFTFKPTEATKIAKIKIQRLAPLNSMFFLIYSTVASSSSFPS
jgi:hypothetical protein